ncbi:carboxylesterase/lipase family protein [Sphingopyxis sp. NJF-3]
MNMAETYIEREIPDCGRISGVRHANLLTFHNIPYASPPVGDLRFLPPQPCRPWDGVRDGRVRGAIAPQLPSRADHVMGPITGRQDEDCLTLAIWAPDRGERDLPVMVWIHGGGFLTGGGALDWYDGSALAADQNMIVVGINYRIGALGYLAIDDRVPGNFALFDQLEALRWVQRNISSFGGNPDAVTVAGESGGAHSIASLLTTPKSQGLFSRAILQSPPLGIGLANAAESQARAVAFLDALGIDAARHDLLDVLRDMPVDRLLQAQDSAGAVIAGRAILGDLRPSVLPATTAPHPAVPFDLTIEAARAAAARRVDILIGWTRDEAAFFLSEHPMLAEPDPKALGAFATALWGKIMARDLLKDAASLRANYIDAVTASAFRNASIRFAEEVADASGNAFVYQFDWSLEDSRRGACHCLDIPFMFGTASAWRDAPLLAGADPASMLRLTETMMASWGGFVRTGDPGFAPWSALQRPLMHFDDPSWLGSVPIATPTGDAELSREALA